MLIATVIVAPSFIDWTSYRNGIAGEIERVLARRVVIDGAVEASLVPTPRLSLRGVRLGNMVGASSLTMAEAEALEVRLAFWPLLTGKLVVTSVVLRKPVIELERLADGRANWMFGGGRTNEGLPEGIQFENAVVTDGTVTYRNARTGSQDRWENINGRFAADGIYGPLRVAGELQYSGVPMRFNLSSGRFDPRGQAATPANVNVEVRGEPRGLTRSQPVLGAGSFSGTVRFADSGPQLNGQVKLNGEDLTDLLTALDVNGKMPDVLAQAFNLEGALELKEHVLAANNLTLRLGETRAQGGVIAAFNGDEPQVDVALTVGRVDLDAWRAAAAKKAAASKDAEKAAGDDDEFILPVELTLTLDVGVDAVTYRGGAARQLKLAAELSDGVVDIHQFSVQLPGATDASFNGKLLAVDGYARLDGQADVASDDFRSLLGWFNVDVSDLPAGRLNKVSATSHLAISRDMLDLGDVDLRFDSTRLTGAVVAALRERPALGVNLIVDQINLDSYVPPAVAEAAQQAATQAARGALPLTVLTEFDANMRLSVGRLEQGKATARNASLDGTLANGVLTMRKLAIADLAGAAVNMSGTLDGFRDKPRVNLEFDVEAQEPSGLLRLTGLALPLSDDALRPFAAHGKIAGRDAAYTIDGTVNAAVMAVSLKGDLKASPTAPPVFTFDIGVEHPSYVGFMKLFNPDFAPEEPAAAQAVALNGHLEGQGLTFNLSSVRGSFGPVNLADDSSIRFDGGLARLNAKLSSNDLDTRNFLAASPARPAGTADEHWSTAPIDLAVARLVGGQVIFDAKRLRLGRWPIEDPKAEILFHDGGIELKRLTGRMLDGQFNLRGRLMPTGRSDAALVLDYALSLEGADLARQTVFDSRNIDLSGGRANFTIEGAGVGSSQAAILADMTGLGSLTMENTVLRGFDLNRLNARYAAAENPGELVRLIQASMASGQTRVANVNGDFTINSGVVAFDDLLIQSSVGNVRALVAADLPHWQLDAAASIRLAAELRAPTLDMQLSGPLNAPKRDFDSEAMQAFVVEESARRAAARNRQPQSVPQTRQQPALQQPPQQNLPQRSAPESNSVPQARQAPQQPQSPSPSPQQQSMPAPYQAQPSQTLPTPLRIDPRTGEPMVQTQPAQAPPSQAPALPDNVGTQPPQPVVPGSRTLSVSPNAAKPESPVPGARVMSVSPNAGRSGPPPDTSRSQDAPIASQPLPAEQQQLGMPPAGQPSPAPDQSQQDPDSFTRDVLRGLGP